MSRAYPFGSVPALWPAPANIVAFSSCRSGGFSSPPYDEFNLGLHVGDDSEAVKGNRQQLLAACEGLEAIQWLQQTHGTTVVPAGATDTLPEADASYTAASGIACAVMTADCLPLLVCDQQGQQIAAIHAGWRGLADGVIERALECFEAAPEHLLVWLGPAISRERFEVGAEVREQFLAAASAAQKPAVAAAFTAHSLQSDHFFADLYSLAKSRLSSLGITAVYGGNHCSYQDSSRFFSYRRDGVTGRMASVIYKTA